MDDSNNGFKDGFRVFPELGGGGFIYQFKGELELSVSTPGLAVDGVLQTFGFDYNNFTFPDK